ncbi:unnamed protein product [Alternaria alternata]
MFILHQHAVDPQEYTVWKEVCLKIFHESSALYDHGRELPIIGKRFALDSPSVSLAEILGSIELRDRDRRLLLSYLLSKAVWQFYHSELVPEHWTKHAVQFMRQERDLLDNRPFLSAELEALVSSRRMVDLASPPQSTHIFPKVLALGVLLLEIELGQGIETHIPAILRDAKGNPKDNAIHLTAGEIIKSSVWVRRLEKRKTLKFVSDAINTCVGPDTAHLGTDPAQVQGKLYSCVVAKFHSMLEVMYGDPGKIDLEPMRHAPCPQSVPAMMLPAQPPTMPRIYGTTNASPTDAALLSSNSAKLLDSSSWLDKFDHCIRTLERSVEGENQRNAIKIAILDTGCNTDDDFFSDVGMNYLDDLPGSGRWYDCVAEIHEPIDQDPKKHGTALTALLLRLVPKALVYVIRVAKDAEHLAQADQNIAKARRIPSKSIDLLLTMPDQAVRYAHSQGVEIVSMSFGFDRTLELSKEAIEKASSMLFFAAANNDGLNSPELFPANHELVIPVRGTSYKGSFEDLFNPVTPGHKPGCRYGTLATDVPCGGPDDSRLIKSGCSVATPIVAAIAATIIMFVDWDSSLQVYRSRVRTRPGVQSVFREMTKDQLVLDRRYLAPWQLCDNTSLHARERIKNALAWS